ncbi:IclR family transcriptional regulator [Natronobacterium texcoconense]|uniref:DNA-binding transcriptional regulator, IclR family n=1 Tax=Natronobacterium texcoconense TaxID=1095778 RepID=A0A1H1FUI4_NATTX|nr:IclR family transcriptional regulator [Natronobacterium texcoconense]SDR04490.1 DNA-binding transcriptional regulator, IclR family [Natronobacterium texcoconense]
MTREAKNPVKATRRSIAILEALFELGTASLTDVSARLDLPDSTVHNHLSTLVEGGFVTRTDGVYRLSLQFLTYGESARDQYRITDAARTELRHLASETEESASAFVEEDGRGFLLAHERADSDLPLDLYPGKRVPLHATAFGKVLLADRPDEEIEAIIDRCGLAACTSETITDRSALLDELADVRSDGHAVADEERLRGVRSVATAVRNERGVAVGAVGITGPTSRLTPERLRGPVLEAVIDTKNVIELQLAYS